MNFEAAKLALLQALDQLKRDITLHPGPAAGAEHNVLQKYDISAVDGSFVGSVQCYAFVTSNMAKAEARRLEVSRFLEPEVPAPAEPILNMLVAQSYLRMIKFDYSFLTGGILAHLNAALRIDDLRIKTDHSSYERVFVPTRDVLEKLGLVLQMQKELSSAPVGFSLVKVKSYFYLFVWSVKALLDSLAVFLKTSYGLPEEGGKIDLGKGEIGKSGFMASLAKHNQPLAERLMKEFRAWINEAQRYRDNTIHKRGILIYALEGHPYRVPKDSRVDPLLAAWMEPAEMDRHYTTATAFSNDWTTQAMELTRLVVTEVGRTMA